MSRKFGLHRVCRSHLQKAAGDCPDQMRSPQQKHFQNLQTRGGTWVEGALSKYMSKSSLCELLEQIVVDVWWILDCTTEDRVAAFTLHGLVSYSRF